MEDLIYMAYLCKWPTLTDEEVKGLVVPSHGLNTEATMTARMMKKRYTPAAPLTNEPRKLAKVLIGSPQ